MPRKAFSRAVLKVSGEHLSGSGSRAIDPVVFDSLAKEILDVKRMGVDLGVVVGGGNIIRGTESQELGIDRATADYMGMLATVVNSLALSSALEKQGLETRVMSAITIEAVAEPYIRRRAIRHLEKGRVVIFAAGTGNPFFSTDSAGALRSIETDAEVFLKGTRVDGVFTADPEVDDHARRYDELSYDRFLADNLAVMDATAVALCRENSLPIIVFNIMEKGSLAKVVAGKDVGTLIGGFDA